MSVDCVILRRKDYICTPQLLHIGTFYNACHLVFHILPPNTILNRCLYATITVKINIKSFILFHKNTGQEKNCFKVIPKSIEK
jgi:hypothetical protein